MFRSFCRNLNTVFTSDSTVTFPVTQGFSQKRETATAIRTRRLTYISQFTTKITYKPGKDNVVDDTLSRIEKMKTPDNFVALSQAQVRDNTIEQMKKQDKLVFKMIVIPGTKKSLLCEMTSGKARPYLPFEFRKEAFWKIHNLSHSGIKTTRKLVAQRFFWPNGV